MILRLHRPRSRLRAEEQPGQINVQRVPPHFQRVTLEIVQVLPLRPVKLGIERLLIILLDSVKLES